MYNLQNIIKNIYNHPEQYILKTQKDNKIFYESVIEFKYVYTGGRWDNYVEYMLHEQKIKNYLTELFKKIYNKDNITINIEVNCLSGSLINKIKIKIGSFFDLSMENISMINQLLLLVAVFIGINGTIYLVQHNNLKKTELQYQENEKQREHEKDLLKIKLKHEKELAAIKILGKEYILEQIQQGNITLDYGKKLNETMNSSFIPDKMKEDEKVNLEYAKVKFSEDISNHKDSSQSISEQLKQYSNKQKTDISF